MTYSITVFDSIFDNSTHKRVDVESFDQFCALFMRLSTLRGRKAVRGEKTKKPASPLISPAIYKADSTRRNNNVVAWAGWAAVDVDNYEGDDELLLRDLSKKYRYICYSTASSTKEKRKFRLVFPLTHHVPADKIRHFWFALNKELGDIGDPQTKDLSRMYYVPAQYPNAYNFIFVSSDGADIDPDELMRRYEYVEKTHSSILDQLPEDVRRDILARRQTQLTNRDVRWTSYRDCPFVSKKLVAEYVSITETGWYHTLYRLMVSIASRAISKKYPITADEIARLCTELDNDTGGWYKNRPLIVEAERALEYAMANSD